MALNNNCTAGSQAEKINTENNTAHCHSRRNIGIQFLNWFVPLAIAIYLF